MSEQSSISKKNEINPRTARAVAAILSQTATDEMMHGLNQSDGRNQSEQASFLAAKSSFLRDIYERGGTVVDGVLTVPRENLSAAPEIELTTTHTAVERLTRLTNNQTLAKELAPKFVEMGERIAGSHADGETRLKVFGWLYNTLEGKQNLFEAETKDLDASEVLKQSSEVQFTEKWQQIVELSEALAELEPKDRLPENSLEELGENLTVAEDYRNALEAENAEQTEELGFGGKLVGFERIEVGTNLPAIPKNLSSGDFEKLLEKTRGIDSQLERGINRREILAPFKRYVELTRLDNELRLAEEEYVKVQTKDRKSEVDYRFIAKREELRELAENRELLALLQEQKNKIGENIEKNFSENIDWGKVEQSINSLFNSPKSEKVELTEGETEFRQLLVKETKLTHEINDLSGSIMEREKGFRHLTELSNERIAEKRKQELLKKVVSLELPVSSVLKEKYPELTEKARNQKLKDANTFEIKNPAEYLFMREAAAKYFQVLRAREIKNEYQKFDNQKTSENLDAKQARRELVKHQEKIQILKQIEPVFGYKIEGSNRIIAAKPSERAVAGYKFADEYIRYQLTQPEIRARHDSAIYREYARRLEAAKTSQDVVRESYQIRQENHRAAQIWKKSSSEERQNLTRPLSKNEMTLLFLEQPPKNYSGEMSVVKYNFAHYSQAKQRMTAALENGSLEPGAEATKLVESLEKRLNRRDPETKRKATKHFFESLKTENEKLVIKNEFDHHALYQNLPPHEKDWIYARAQEQKENLQYKIAYEREKSAGLTLQQPQTQVPAVNEAATSLREEFAEGTLWHQAVNLSESKKPNETEKTGNLEEKTIQTIGHLIHNQSDMNNFRIARWLDKQKPNELKTAGEILKTFAGAKREIENNQLTITVKIPETSRFSANDYKKLFEVYFPANYEKLKEFRLQETEKFRLEHSRRIGQSALLENWKQEMESATYQMDAPVKVFENEQITIEEIEKIKKTQIECRRANEIKNAVLLKYEDKLRQEFAKANRTFSDEDLRIALERAFTPQKSSTLSPEQKAVFDKAQDKILSSDFERFTENTNRIEKGISEINQSFAAIAELRSENSRYEIAPEKTETIDLQQKYEAIRQKAEAEQITFLAREKFSTKTIENDQKESAKIVEFVSIEERESARIESYQKARIDLEPAQLNHLEQTSEIRDKALEFADALEEAHQSSLRGASKTEIADAFAIADAKREQLGEALKIEKEFPALSERKPVTLIIYERELARNERLIAHAKISNLLESGKLSLHDLETKKASEIFSAEERGKIRLEAGERTRENLEPKELWAKKQDLSEKMQQTALKTSEILEEAHEIYHTPNANPKEVSQAFAALDTSIIRLKNQRRNEKSAAKFINFKTDFKRDLAQMFDSRKPFENSELLTAMTKGLLINALEKQDVQPEKIGLNSEKLSEISLTISMAITDGKKREHFNHQKFGTIFKPSETNVIVKPEAERMKQPVQAQPKQHEKVK